MAPPPAAKGEPEWGKIGGVDRLRGGRSYGWPLCELDRREADDMLGRDGFVEAEEDGPWSCDWGWWWAPCERSSASMDGSRGRGEDARDKG